MGLSPAVSSLKGAPKTLIPIGRPRRYTAKHSNPAFAAHRPRRERKKPNRFTLSAYSPRSSTARFAKYTFSSRNPQKNTEKPPYTFCRAQPTNKYRKNGHSCVANTPPTKKQQKSRPRADRAQHSCPAAFLDFPAPERVDCSIPSHAANHPLSTEHLPHLPAADCGCPPCRPFPAFLRSL